MTMAKKLFQHQLSYRSFQLINTAKNAEGIIIFVSCLEFLESNMFGNRNDLNSHTETITNLRYSNGQIIYKNFISEVFTNTVYTNTDVKQSHNLNLMN